MRRLFAVFVCFAAAANGVAAADLARIPRTVAKEPTYPGKPSYCLLVFGPEAADRVWLVRAGDFLYADRNGNGDLTEAGERVGVDGTYSPPGAQPRFREYRYFKVKSIAALTGPAKAAALWVMELRPNREMQPRTPEDRDFKAREEQHRFASHFNLSLQTPEGPLAYTGEFRFADRPQDAPIVHFFGPRTLGLADPAGQVLFRGEKPTELRVSVGSQGLGENTFAAIMLPSLPDDAFPVAEIEFPGQGPHAQPLRARFELRERC